MWPVLPKDCNCTETASNPGAVCNALYTSNQFFYNGINSICNDLQNGDDLSVAIQKLENFLCSIEVTQVFLTYLEENIEEFPEFITLVNDALTCQTITNCFIPTTTTTTSSSTTTTTSTSTSTTTTTTSSTTSTTTTTTTAAPQCKSYVVQSTIENASWQAIRCSDEQLVGQIFPVVGTIGNIDCVFDTTLVLSGMVINSDGECTTTTTTSSTTTTTTTTTIPSSLNWDYQKNPPSEGLLTIDINSINVLGQTTNGTGTIVCNVGDILAVEAVPTAITDTVELTISNSSGTVFYDVQVGISITAPPITILAGEDPYIVDVNFYDVSF